MREKRAPLPFPWLALILLALAGLGAGFVGCHNNSAPRPAGPAAGASGSGGMGETGGSRGRGEGGTSGAPGAAGAGGGDRGDAGGGAGIGGRGGSGDPADPRPGSDASAIDAAGARADGATGPSDAADGRGRDTAAPPRTDTGVAPPAATGFVEWMWSGAVTTAAGRVVAKVKGAEEATLRVSEAADLARPVLVPGVSNPVGADQIVHFQLTGLRPGTTYHYAVQRKDALDGKRGQVRTHQSGAFSFRFVSMACSDTGVDDVVFDEIAAEAPLFLMHSGDLHYADPGRSNDPMVYRALFDQALTLPRQASLFRAVPIAYVWDDHDVGKSAAGRLAFQLYVPHHPLVEGKGEDAIPYHAFTVGRTRFIVTDLRSRQGTRDANDLPSMMGTAQKAWFKQELSDARGKYKVVFWVNTAPWIGPAEPGTDRWWSFAEERRELSEHIAALGMKNLITIGGDAHMIAYDDGRNSGYAAGGAGGFPLFHAAALSRPGSVKGGPFSGGAFPDTGQYGVFDVQDDGKDTVRVTFTGKKRGVVRLMQTLTMPAP